MRSTRILFSVALLLGTSNLGAQRTSLLQSEHWTRPTPEELSMTSIPQVPGAPAVYLFREETTEDRLSMFSIYVRIKVLTEEGRKYADIELPFVRSEGSFTVDSIAGRTIHADGTIIPFNGKPYEKLIDKEGHAGFDQRKVVAKVFSLPSVEVGSILEYRYQMHAEYSLMAPSWLIQSELYTLKAHFHWKPTNGSVLLKDDHDQVSRSIAWFKILPPYSDFKQTNTPGGSLEANHTVFDLNVHDVPPTPDEEFMPPYRSLTYRVMFYYAPVSSPVDYWNVEGKLWSKDKDKFIGPGPQVKAATAQIATAADTPEQKLHKIYDKIMTYENTDFTREHTAREVKLEGPNKIKTTDDLLLHQRGSSDQLTALFVAMARAAGLDAYIASVVDRDKSVFIPGFLDTSQFDDDIAVVDIDGDSRFFDPGQRLCEYGQLAWKHTIAGGLRQTKGGAEILTTPEVSYKLSHVTRLADLTIDEQGTTHGSMTFTYTGDPALEWRQDALLNDEAETRKHLHDTLQAMLPSSLELAVTHVDALADSSHPLVVHAVVTGSIGSHVGNRMILPSNILLVNEKPAFSQPTRITPVYFHYTGITQDIVRISFPPSVALENTLDKDRFLFKESVSYNRRVETTPTSFTLRRDLILGKISFPRDDYSGLHAFYTRFETADQEPIVLIRK